MRHFKNLGVVVFLIAIIFFFAGYSMNLEPYLFFKVLFALAGIFFLFLTIDSFIHHKAEFWTKIHHKIEGPQVHFFPKIKLWLWRILLLILAIVFFFKAGEL
jgi:hypothetical protein